MFMKIAGILYGRHPISNSGRKKSGVTCSGTKNIAKLTNMGWRVIVEWKRERPFGRSGWKNCCMRLIVIFNNCPLLGEKLKSGQLYIVYNSTGKFVYFKGKLIHNSE